MMFGAGIRLLALVALVLGIVWLVGSGIGQIRRARATAAVHKENDMTDSGIAPIAYLLLVALFFYISLLGGA